MASKKSYREDGAFAQRADDAFAEGRKGDFDGFVFGLINLGDSARFAHQASYISSMMQKKMKEKNNTHLLADIFFARYNDLFTERQKALIKNRLIKMVVAENI